MQLPACAIPCVASHGTARTATQGSAHEYTAHEYRKIEPDTDFIHPVQHDHLAFRHVRLIVLFD